MATLDDKEHHASARSVLHAKTEELHHFFTLSADLFCIVDTEGRIHEINPAWEKTLGYTRAEILAHRLFDLVRPDDATQTHAAFKDLKNKKEVLHSVNHLRCRDGSYRRFEWNSSPHDSLVYSTGRDITHRSVNERTPRKSE